MTFSNRVYDTLKWIAQYLLPAAGTLYFALARIWDFPFAEEVVGTVTAIDTFLGVLLGISSMNYEGDGEISIEKALNEQEAESADDNSVILYSDLEDLKDRKTIVIKVAE